MRRAVFLLMALLLLVPRPGHAQADEQKSIALDPLLGPEGLAAAPAADAFMSQWQRTGFQWLSDERQRAHAYRMPHTLFGQPVVETIAAFPNGALSALAFTLYARGDAGSISEKEFGDRIRTLREAVSAWAGSQPRPVDDQLQTRGVKRAAEAWTKDGLTIRLVCSWSTRVSEAVRFQAEYIRIEAAPGRQAAAPAAPALSRPQRGREVAAADLRAAIQRETNGDVWIRGIPMVDQGDKGYCAVASVARVLQFYGIQTDQHEIAQLAKSSADFGTNPEQMIDVLKRVGAKLGCRVRIYNEYEWREFERFIQKYNSLAKRKDLAEIDPFQYPSVDGMYRAMDIDVLRDARQKDASGYRGFRRDILGAIAEGIPLAWGVTTGKVPETPEVMTIGGHMRLIIGYNEKEDRVLYSDSWGAGHERKSMPFPDAWAITHGLYAIEPRHVK